MSSEGNNDIGGISAEQLKNFVRQLENLEAEKAKIQEMFKDAMAEAKSEGFDPKILKKVLRLRKMKKEDVLEEEEMTDLYMNALQGE